MYMYCKVYTYIVCSYVLCTIVMHQWQVHVLQQQAVYKPTPLASLASDKLVVDDRDVSEVIRGTSEHCWPATAAFGDGMSGM